MCSISLVQFLMNLKRNNDDLVCVKCSQCPNQTQEQLECGENQFAASCEITDNICNGTEFTTGKPDDQQESVCIDTACKCNAGFCRQIADSSDDVILDESPCISCNATAETCS